MDISPPDLRPEDPTKLLLVLDSPSRSPVGTVTEVDSGVPDPLTDPASFVGRVSPGGTRGN